ncbi:MAG: autotransporter-associated beta strand repeat-containing protein, partial [Chthoniobacter sp.]
MPSPKNSRKAAHISKHFIRRLSSWIVLSTALTLGVAKLAYAGPVYWDGDADPSNNALPPTTGLGGTGTWDTTNLRWWDGASASDQAWVNANSDTAVFAGAAGTVTLGTPITVGNLTFNTSGYTITGSALTMTGGVISVDPGQSDTISSQVSGTAGLTKVGTGTLYLTNSANDYTGATVIGSGTVVITTATALGADTSTVIVNGFGSRGIQGGE